MVTVASIFIPGCRFLYVDIARRNSYAVVAAAAAVVVVVVVVAVVVVIIVVVVAVKVVPFFSFGT